MCSFHFVGCWFSKTWYSRDTSYWNYCYNEVGKIINQKQKAVYSKLFGVVKSFPWSWEKTYGHSTKCDRGRVWKSFWKTSLPFMHTFIYETELIQKFSWSETNLQSFKNRMTFFPPANIFIKVWIQIYQRYSATDLWNYAIILYTLLYNFWVDHRPP